MNIRRSLLIAFSQSYVQLAIQFVASLIIARLLTPREIGVFSVSMVFIAMVNTFRDFGVVDYVVQERDLTRERIRSAALVTFITAWGIGLLVALGAGWVAEFYREPDVAWVMRILALNFFLLPFGSVAMAHMRRNLRFDDWSKIHVASGLAQSVSAVALAYLGMSYFSMALGAVLASCVTILLVWHFRDPEMDFTPARGDWRRVVSFGGINTGINILLETSRGLPDVILGRLASLDAVGFFSRATGLIDLFNRLVMQAVNAVALPHLAHRLRRGEDVSDAYLLGLSHLTALAWPFMLFLSQEAGPLVRLLFGSQWEASIGIVSLLALAEMMLAPLYLQQQYFVARGQMRIEALRQLMMLMVRAAPFLILSSQGLEAVALGCVAAYGVILLLSLGFLSRHGGIGPGRVVKALTPSVVLALLMVGVLLALSLLELPGGAVVDLMVRGALFSALWLAALMLTRHSLSGELRTLWMKVREGRD